VIDYEIPVVNTRHMPSFVYFYVILEH